MAYILKSLIVGPDYAQIGSNIGRALMGAFGGLQTGTEYIPRTGLYKLEEGEKVVPRYDAIKKEKEPLQILNVITPEAVAMAMAGKAGENVIMNIINTNSLRNGVFRTEILRR
jgi:hypothetical protein